jgi:hypothetical protein
VQRVRRRCPDEPVERDAPTEWIDEEDGARSDGGEVDRPTERHEDAGVDVEPVERVQDVDVLAVGDADGAASSAVRRNCGMFPSSS